MEKPKKVLTMIKSFCKVGLLGAVLCGISLTASATTLTGVVAGVSASQAGSLSQQQILDALLSGQPLISNLTITTTK